MAFTQWCNEFLLTINLHQGNSVVTIKCNLIVHAVSEFNFSVRQSFKAKNSMKMSQLNAVNIFLAIVAAKARARKFKFKKLFLLCLRPKIRATLRFRKHNGGLFTVYGINCSPSQGLTNPGPCHRRSMIDPQTRRPGLVWCPGISTFYQSLNQVIFPLNDQNLTNFSKRMNWKNCQI